VFCAWHNLQPRPCFSLLLPSVSAIAHHPSNACPRFVRWGSDTAIHFCQSTLVVDPTWLVGYNSLVTCRLFRFMFSRIERTVAPDRISCVIAQLSYPQTWRRRNFLAMYASQLITDRIAADEEYPCLVSTSLHWPYSRRAIGTVPLYRCL
jgi:hypothetical protein